MNKKEIKKHEEFSEKLINRLEEIALGSIALGTLGFIGYKTYELVYQTADKISPVMTGFYSQIQDFLTLYS